MIFPQQQVPGRLGLSDFTRMGDLGVSVCRTWHPRNVRSRTRARRWLRMCIGLSFAIQGGCAEPAAIQSEKLDAVRVGMVRQEVLEILGPPQRQEIYGETEFLIYSTDGTSHTALIGFTPIAIVDGRVTGTGRSLYAVVVEPH